MFSMLVTIVLTQNAELAAAPVDAPRVRQAVEKSLPFLAKAGLEWETTRCVSCHHGPWMLCSEAGSSTSSPI